MRSGGPLWLRRPRWFDRPLPLYAALRFEPGLTSAASLQLTCVCPSMDTVWNASVSTGEHAAEQREGEEGANPSPNPNPNPNPKPNPNPNPYPNPHPHQARSSRSKDQGKSASMSSTDSYAVCLVNPCRCAGPTPQQARGANLRHHHHQAWRDLVVYVRPVDSVAAATVRVKRGRGLARISLCRHARAAPVGGYSICTGSLRRYLPP